MMGVMGVSAHAGIKAGLAQALLEVASVGPQTLDTFGLLLQDLEGGHAGGGHSGRMRGGEQEGAVRDDAGSQSGRGCQHT